MIYCLRKLSKSAGLHLGKFLFSCPFDQETSRGWTISLKIGLLDEIFESAECKINQAQGDIGSIVQNKFKTFAKKNPGLSEMKKSETFWLQKLTSLTCCPAVVSSMKFSPLTTVEVEKKLTLKRLFSRIEDEFDFGKC